MCAEVARVWREGKNSFLIAKLRARADTVGDACPRLNAEVGRVWHMPKKEIIGEGEVHAHSPCALAVTEGEGVYGDFLKDKRIRCEELFVHRKNAPLGEHSRAQLGNERTVKHGVVEGDGRIEENVIVLDTLGGVIALVRTDGEIHYLVRAVVDRIGRDEGILTKLVNDTQAKREGVLRERLLVFAKQEHGALLRELLDLVGKVLGEAVLSHVIGLALVRVGVVFYASRDGEENGRTFIPDGALRGVNIFGIAASYALELCAELGNADGEHFVLNGNHIRPLFFFIIS